MKKPPTTLPATLEMILTRHMCELARVIAEREGLSAGLLGRAVLEMKATPDWVLLVVQPHLPGATECDVSAWCVRALSEVTR